MCFEQRQQGTRVAAKNWGAFHSTKTFENLATTTNGTEIFGKAQFPEIPKNIFFGGREATTGNASAVRRLENCLLISEMRSCTSGKTVFDRIGQFTLSRICYHLIGATVRKCGRPTNHMHEYTRMFSRNDFCIRIKDSLSRIICLQIFGLLYFKVSTSNGHF